MNEVKRIKDVDFDFSYKSICLNCGNEFELYWNGGELDHKKCCGYHYSLQHTKIDFVTEK